MASHHITNQLQTTSLTDLQPLTLDAMSLKMDDLTRP